MNLQEQTNRMKQMMGLLNENDPSYSLTQIKKGLDKSEKENDITINTTVDNVIDNISKYKTEIGSVESFLDDEDSFISEALPGKLIDYIQKRGLDIDISNLIKYNDYRREYIKNEDNIALLTYTGNKEDEETQQEIERLINRNDELYDYLPLLKDEVLRVKEEILNGPHQ